MKREIRFLLLYPPHQSWPGSLIKPNGSLAYPNLAGALLEKGIEVTIFDACTGNYKDRLEEVFYKQTQLPSGLVRTGVSKERILEEVAGYDVVGLTSIFSDQETMVLSTLKSIKKAFPEKLVISGGVNARSRQRVFFESGVDIICLSEAERTIQQIAEVVQSNSVDFSKIPSISFRGNNGTIIVNKTRAEDIIYNLDQLPMPAWHLLPNERYWKIARPHGGHFKPNQKLCYASMMTSMGCPFKCIFCHIAGETSDSESGGIGKFRVKSSERVYREIDELKRLGIKQLYIEDDSLFGMKRRGINVLRGIKGNDLDILNVNGINVVHLLRNNKPDGEVIELLAEIGFREIALPFESGSSRIIKKYASSKWNIDRADVEGLIRKCKEYEITLAGNFMIGFPDETRVEINQTLQYAKRLKDSGLDSVNIFLVLPLPGTPLFSMAMEEGYMAKDFDIDKMHWLRANLINTLVEPAELEEIRNRAWEELNHSEFKEYKRTMI